MSYSDLSFSKRRAVESIHTALAHVNRLLINEGEYVPDADYHKLESVRSFLKDMARIVENVNVTLDRREIKR